MPLLANPVKFENVANVDVIKQWIYGNRDAKNIKAINLLNQKLLKILQTAKNINAMNL
jgi:hypothetical protein